MGNTDYGITVGDSTSFWRYAQLPGVPDIDISSFSACCSGCLNKPCFIELT